MCLILNCGCSGGHSGHCMIMVTRSIGYLSIVLVFSIFLSLYTYIYIYIYIFASLSLFILSHPLFLLTFFIALDFV